MFSSRQFKPWICDFLCRKDPVSLRFSKTVAVFSHKGFSSNGCVVKEITDGNVFIKALFTTTAVSNAIQNNDVGEGWGSAILVLRDIKVEFCCESYLEAPEYVFVVNKYVIWDHQNGFKMKKSIEWCMNDLRVQKAAEEALKEKYQTSVVSMSEMGDNSESQSISVLLQEMGEASLESSTSNSAPPSSSKYRSEEELMTLLRRPLSVKEFLIPETAETALNAITEWNPDYRPDSSPLSSSEVEKQLSSVEEFDFQRTSTLVTVSTKGPVRRRKELSAKSNDGRDSSEVITEKADATSNKKQKVSIIDTQSQGDRSVWQDCLDSVCLSDESSDIGSPNAHSTIKDIESNAHSRLNTDSVRTKKTEDHLVPEQEANRDAVESAIPVDSAKVFESSCASESDNTKSSSDISVNQSSVVMVSSESIQSDSISNGITASDKKSLQYVSVCEQAELDRLGALTAVHTDVSGISSGTEFSQSALYKEGIPDGQNTNGNTDQTDQQNEQNAKKGSEDLFKDSSSPLAGSQQNPDLYGSEKTISESCENCTDKDGSQNDLTSSSGGVLTTSQDSHNRNNAIFPLSDSHLTSSEVERCKDRNCSKGKGSNGSDDSSLTATPNVQTMSVSKESSDSAEKMMLVRPNLESSSGEMKRDLTSKAAYHHTIAMVRRSQESILRKKVVCLSVKKSQSGSTLQQTNISRSSQGSDDSLCNQTSADFEKSIMLRYYKESSTNGSICPARNHVTTTTPQCCDFVMENTGHSDESRSSSKQDRDRLCTNQGGNKSHAQKDRDGLCSKQNGERSCSKQDGDKDEESSYSKQDGDRSCNGQEEDRSHARQDRERSCSKQDGDKSCSKQDEDRSQARQDREKSCSEQDGDKSGAKQDGDRSCSKQDGDRSHARQDKGKSCSEQDGDKSGAKQDGERSCSEQDIDGIHAKHDGDRSHTRQDIDGSHAQKDRGTLHANQGIDKSHAKQQRNRSHAKQDGESSCSNQDGERSHPTQDGDSPCRKQDGGRSCPIQVGSKLNAKEKESENNSQMIESNNQIDRRERSTYENTETKDDLANNKFHNEESRLGSRKLNFMNAVRLIRICDKEIMEAGGKRLARRDCHVAVGSPNFVTAKQTPLSGNQIRKPSGNGQKVVSSKHGFKDKSSSRLNSNTANKASVCKQTKLNYINVTDCEGINNMIKLCSVVLNRLDEQKLRELTECNKQVASSEKENFLSEYEVKFCNENLISRYRPSNVRKKANEQNSQLLRVTFSRKASHPPKDKTQKLVSNASKGSLADKLETKQIRTQVDTVYQRKNTEAGYNDKENEIEESVNSPKPHKNSDSTNQNKSTGSLEESLDHLDKDEVSCPHSQGFSTQPFVYNPFEETLSFEPILSQRRTASFLGRIIVRDSSEIPIKTSESASHSNRSVQKDHLVGSVKSVSDGNCLVNMKGGYTDENGIGSNNFKSSGGGFDTVKENPVVKLQAHPERTAEKIRMMHMNQTRSVRLNVEPQSDAVTNDLQEERVNNLDKIVSKENNRNGKKSGNHQTHSCTSPDHLNKEVQKKMHVTRSLSKNIFEAGACQEQDIVDAEIKDTKKQNDTSSNIQTDTGRDRQKLTVKNNQNDTSSISQKCTDRLKQSKSSSDKQTDTDVIELIDRSAIDRQDNIVGRDVLEKIKKKEDHGDNVENIDNGYIKDRNKGEDRKIDSIGSKCMGKKINQTETEGTRPCKRKRNDKVYNETESNQENEKSQKKRARQEAISVEYDKPDYELVASSAEMDYLLSKLPPKEPVKECVKMFSSVQRLAMTESILTAMYPDCTVLDTNYRLKAKNRPLKECKTDRDDCFNLRLKGYKRQEKVYEISSESSEDDNDEIGRKSTPVDTENTDDFFSFIHVLNKGQRKGSDQNKRNTKDKLTIDKTSTIEKASPFNKLTKSAEKTVIESEKGHSMKKSLDEINASRKLTVNVDELTGALRFSRESRNESTNKTADTVVPVKGPVPPVKSEKNIQNKSESDKGNVKNEVLTKKTVATRKNSLENYTGKVSQQTIQTVSEDIRNVKENENNDTCVNDTRQMLTRNSMKQIRNSIVDKGVFLQDWLRTSNFTKGSQKSDIEED